MDPAAYEAWFGRYQGPKGAALGFGRLGGLALVDYGTGSLRRAEPQPDGSLRLAGPSPAQTLRLEADGTAPALVIENAGGPRLRAVRLPYAVEPVAFAVGPTERAAMLYLPGEGNAPFPAAVLVPGSGAADDVYAYYLLGEGFAALTYDAESRAPTADLRTRAAAPMAAADSLLMRHDIRPDQVGLLGLGDGAAAAAHIAARAPETAFLVLSGPGGGLGPAQARDLAPLLSQVYCPVLALLAGDQAAAAPGLSAALAHNDAATVTLLPAGAAPEGIAPGWFAALGPWLRRQAR